MRLTAATAVAMVIATAVVIVARAADPDALWKIVHDRCVTDMQVHADPAPCETVALGGGYAILKDMRGASQYLLIPTARITGIEGPEILAPDAPNYFHLAWLARNLVSARVRHMLPDDDISLAINSMYGRTQNQLHIHIDCIRSDVHDILATTGTEIGTSWTRLVQPLAGGAYRAIRISESDNPFVVLAASLPDAPADMGRHTLVMTTAGGALVLLDGVADPTVGARGSGEDLQDHECHVAQSSHGQ